jgi:hypothetical protein
MKLFHTKPMPQIRTDRRRRIVKKYAYVPVRLENGDVIWLENYVVDQKWRFYKRRFVTFRRMPMSISMEKRIRHQAELDRHETCLLKTQK